MGRKPKITGGNESELAQYDMAVLGRLVQVLAQGNNATTAGGQLEDLIESLPKTLWLKKLAQDIAAKFNALSDEQWGRGFLGFCSQWADGISKYYVAQGIEDPLKNRALEEKVGYIAKQGFGRDNPDIFMQDIRTGCKMVLDQFSQSQISDKEISSTVDGLFTQDVEKNINLLNLIFSLAGGESLVEIVEETAVTINKQMDSQMALIAAIEMIETQHKWVESKTEVGFHQFWTSIKPRLVSAVDKHMLELPGTRLISEVGPYPEEMLFLQESVFEELLKRMNNDPFAVFQDAMEGRLHNSLVISIIHDIRDRIKYLRAGKRDIKSEETVDREKRNEKIIDPEVQVPDQPGQYIIIIDIPTA
jgi:hypothetical protein